MFNKIFSEIMLWDNVEKFGRARNDTDENLTVRMRFECCIPKATDTQPEYETIKLLLFQGNSGYANAP
jgi:hypothetical protein